MNKHNSYVQTFENLFWKWLMASVTLLVIAAAIPAFGADVFIDEGDGDFEPSQKPEAAVVAPVVPPVVAPAVPVKKKKAPPASAQQLPSKNKKRLPASSRPSGGRFATTSKECALESAPGAGDSLGITKAPRKLWVEDSGSETHWKVFNRAGQANYLSKNCF